MDTATQAPRPELVFSQILDEDRHNKPLSYEFHMRRMFRGVPLQGKSVLDIGSGRGLTSMWVGLQGARRVVSMEPEMEGSRSGVVQIQRDRIDRLKLNQIEIVTCNFQNFDTEEPFDVVVSNASINHLEESELHALHDESTFDSFVAIASRMKQWLQPGGVAVITDASRYGFFQLARAVGLPKRFCYFGKSLNYRIHQNAGTWRKIFLAAGFRNVEIEYPIPYVLRHVEPLANNTAASFFLKGSFILRARNG